MGGKFLLQEGGTGKRSGQKFIGNPITTANKYEEHAWFWRKAIGGRAITGRSRSVPYNSCAAQKRVGNGNAH